MSAVVSPLPSLANRVTLLSFTTLFVWLQSLPNEIFEPRSSYVLTLRVALGLGFGNLTFGFINGSDPAPMAFLPDASRTVLPADVDNDDWTAFTVKVDIDTDSVLENLTIAFGAQRAGASISMLMDSFESEWQGS